MSLRKWILKPINKMMFVLCLYTCIYISMIQILSKKILKSLTST